MKTTPEPDSLIMPSTCGRDTLRALTIDPMHMSSFPRARPLLPYTLPTSRSWPHRHLRVKQEIAHTRKVSFDSQRTRRNTILHESYRREHDVSVGPSRPTSRRPQQDRSRRQSRASAGREDAGEACPPPQHVTLPWQQPIEIPALTSESKGAAGLKES